MTAADAANGGLEEVIARGMRGEQVDVLGAFLAAQVVVPSGEAVSDGFGGFVPVLYEREGVPILAVFTSLDRATVVSAMAPFAVTMTGRELVDRMPPDYGIVVNPGHGEGFDMSPQSVAGLRAAN
jgi:hypothetical protein